MDLDGSRSARQGGARYATAWPPRPRHFLISRNTNPQIPPKVSRFVFRVIPLSLALSRSLHELGSRQPMILPRWAQGWVCTLHDHSQQLHMFCPCSCGGAFLHASWTCAVLVLRKFSREGLRTTSRKFGILPERATVVLNGVAIRPPGAWRVSGLVAKQSGLPPKHVCVLAKMWIRGRPQRPCEVCAKNNTNKYLDMLLLLPSGFSLVSITDSLSYAR